jgi:hypothetical protein
MRSIVIRAFLLLAFLAAGLGSASAQEWLLNAGASHFYMGTAKNNAVMETHQFTGLDGSISKDGDASVKIDLTSVASCATCACVSCCLKHTSSPTRKSPRSWT